MEDGKEFQVFVIQNLLWIWRRCFHDEEITTISSNGLAQSDFTLTLTAKEEIEMGTGTKLRHDLATENGKARMVTFSAASDFAQRPKLDAHKLLVDEDQGVEGLVLSRSGHAREGQAGQEGFHLLFRREGFELWVHEKRGIAAKPVEVGFFGVDREVAECTNLSH